MYINSFSHERLWNDIDCSQDCNMLQFYQMSRRKCERVIQQGLAWYTILLSNALGHHELDHFQWIAKLKTGKKYVPIQELIEYIELNKLQKSPKKYKFEKVGQIDEQAGWFGTWIKKRLMHTSSSSHHSCQQLPIGLASPAFGSEALPSLASFKIFKEPPKKDSDIGTNKKALLWRPAGEMELALRVLPYCIRRG